MDYEPGMGSKPLFPKMHLETCEGTVSSVRTTVELQTGHIGKGCDRETYSEKSLQKLCGEFNESVCVNMYDADRKLAWISRGFYQGDKHNSQLHYFLDSTSLQMVWRSQGWWLAQKIEMCSWQNIFLFSAVTESQSVSDMSGFFFFFFVKNNSYLKGKSE